MMYPVAYDFTRSSVAQVVVGGLFGGTLKHFGDHVLAQETHDLVARNTMQL